MSYSHGELVQLAEEGRRKKMPRYIDADALLARYKERCEGCKETKNYCEHCCDLADVIDDIEDAPTVDAVEVVRCKDCEYCEEFDPGRWWRSCGLMKIVGGHIGPGFYCGYGRRRKTDGSTNT